MLKTRILTAAVLIPLLLAALFYLPAFEWAGLIAVIVVLGAIEWARISGFGMAGRIVYAILTLLFIGCLWFGQQTTVIPVIHETIIFAGALFWIFIAPAWLKFHWRIHNRILQACVGWVLLLPPWIAIVELRDKSAAILLFVMGIVWIADSAAYFTGRKWGRRKLAPEISPGKTWEGVVGALLGVALYGVIFVVIAQADVLSGSFFDWAGLIIVLWILTTVSIIGDLFESLAKRQAGVKDSGRLIPGHGGILDRIDSLTAVLPVAAALEHGMKWITKSIM